VRTSWIKGTDEQELGDQIAIRHGQLVAYTADDTVAVSDNGLAVFVPPLRPTLNIGDADGFVARGTRLESGSGASSSGAST
jgi:hypothetical protein